MNTPHQAPVSHRPKYPPEHFPDFLSGYLSAICFTECHAGHPQLQHAEISRDAREAARRACSEFFWEFLRLLTQAAACESYSFEQAGVDFWLTRNHHGAGYWDRNQLPKELGEVLTEAAHAFGECYAMLGDDGRLHLSDEEPTAPEWPSRPRVYVLSLRCTQPLLQDLGLSPRKPFEVLSVFERLQDATRAASNLVLELERAFQEERPGLKLRSVADPQGARLGYEGHLLAQVQIHPRELTQPV